MKYKGLPIWPMYIGERRTTFAKAYGIKVRCYGEHVGGAHWELGEDIQNLMGTHWELKGNKLGTKEKLKKNQLMGLHLIDSH